MNLNRGFERDRGVDNREAMKEEVETDFTKENAARIFVFYFTSFLLSQEQRPTSTNDWWWRNRQLSIIAFPFARLCPILEWLNYHSKWVIKDAVKEIKETLRRYWVAPLTETLCAWLNTIFYLIGLGYTSNNISRYIWEAFCPDLARNPSSTSRNR